MHPIVRKPDPLMEFDTPEGCRILDSWNEESDPGMSIARATVRPGITTQLHSLRGVDERYLITHGLGVVTVEGFGSADVKPGDIVFIPSDTAQQVTNTGDVDLVFYCICTPRFSADCYVARE